MFKNTSIFVTFLFSFFALCSCGQDNFYKKTSTPVEIHTSAQVEVHTPTYKQMVQEFKASHEPQIFTVPQEVTELKISGCSGANGGAGGGASGSVAAQANFGAAYNSFYGSDGGNSGNVNNVSNFSSGEPTFRGNRIDKNMPSDNPKLRPTGIFGPWIVIPVHQNQHGDHGGVGIQSQITSEGKVLIEFPVAKPTVDSPQKCIGGVNGQGGERVLPFVGIEEFRSGRGAANTNLPWSSAFIEPQSIPVKPGQVIEVFAGFGGVGGAGGRGEYMYGGNGLLDGVHFPVGGAESNKDWKGKPGTPGTPGEDGRIIIEWTAVEWH